MIFVTVGTHEQPFNRLIKEIDNITGSGKIKERVIVQYGFSTYKAKNCEMHRMMSFNEMRRMFNDARIVITHGGPSSFIEALQAGKVPIVVPRQASFNEHINNHQVEFVKLVSEKIGNIIPVYDINTLWDVICDYDSIEKHKRKNSVSNNAQFNRSFEKIVQGMFEKI